MSLLDCDFNTDFDVLKSVCLEKVRTRIGRPISIKYQPDKVVNFEHLINNPGEYILGRYLDIYVDEYVISIFHRPEFCDDAAASIFGAYHELFYLDYNWNMDNVLNFW